MSRVLKSPGFSTQLYPVDSENLVGVGYDADDQFGFSWAQGVKISVFAKNEKGELHENDKLILGQRGSFSDASHDSHAFFWDNENRALALPVNIFDGAAGGDFYVAPNLVFSGVKLLSLSVSGKLIEETNLTHASWINPECKRRMGPIPFWSFSLRSFDINRLSRDGSDYLALSRFGITWHPVNNVKQKSSNLEFPAVEPTKLCPALGWGQM